MIAQGFTPDTHLTSALANGRLSGEFRRSGQGSAKYRQLRLNRLRSDRFVVVRDFTADPLFRNLRRPVPVPPRRSELA